MCPLCHSAQLLEHPEWAHVEIRSLGSKNCSLDPSYRSLGAAAAVEADVTEEEEEAVVVVADANPAAAEPAVEGPVDTSSDAAIAEALQEEEQANKAPPKVGDKRSLDTSARDKPASNMSLTRQSRASKSAGEAPKIRSDVERTTEGCVVITETISVGLKKGTMPTEADILAIEALVGERIEAAKKAGGVSEIKKLSGTLAAKMGGRLHCANVAPDQVRHRGHHEPRSTAPSPLASLRVSFKKELRPSL